MEDHQHELMTRPTSDQILALAPDASAAKAGQGLASARNWQSLGHGDTALWGLCQGSGKNPYQVRVALPEMASQCSCPSRKFPCKHALGLMLLFAHGVSVPAAEPPEFVREWLDKRSARAEKKVEREQRPINTEVAAPQAAKREDQREERIAQGLAELRTWIEDLVAAGFAHAPVHDPAFWGARARRLVDAQAPGLARQVAELAAIAHGDATWPERLLGRLARLYLVTEAHARSEALEPNERADLKRVLGIAQRQEDVDTENPVDDRWLCLGEVQGDIDRLQMRRTWLYGRSTDRIALVLSFAPQGKPLPPTMMPGAEEHASVAFFPASVPERATFVARGATSDSAPTAPPGFEIEGALDRIADVRARDPWLVPLPMLLAAALRRDRTDRWWLIDSTGDGLPVDCGARRPWEWLAYTGGRSCVWFGEWNGAQLMLVSAWPSMEAAA
jgi:hypothetical protein